MLARKCECSSNRASYKIKAGNTLVSDSKINTKKVKKELKLVDKKLLIEKIEKQLQSVRNG